MDTSTCIEQILQGATRETNAQLGVQLHKRSLVEILSSIDIE